MTEQSDAAKVLAGLCTLIVWTAHNRRHGVDYQALDVSGERVRSESFEQTNAGSVGILQRKASRAISGNYS